MSNDKKYQNRHQFLCGFTLIHNYNKIEQRENIIIKYFIEYLIHIYTGVVVWLKEKISLLPCKSYEMN